MSYCSCKIHFHVTVKKLIRYSKLPYAESISIKIIDKYMSLFVEVSFGR